MQNNSQGFCPDIRVGGKGLFSCLTTLHEGWPGFSFAKLLLIAKVRYMEDMEPLGLTWVKLGLQDVLYDPKTKTVFTPNTGEEKSLAGEQRALTEDFEDDILEVRSGKGQPRDKNGRFASTGKKSKGKTKYAPSKRRNTGGINLKPRKYARLCGVFGTHHPNSSAGAKYDFTDSKFTYIVTADGYGGFVVNKIKKI